MKKIIILLLFIGTLKGATVSLYSPKWTSNMTAFKIYKKVDNKSIQTFDGFIKFKNEDSKTVIVSGQWMYIIEED